MSVLELLAELVKQLIPAIDVLADILELLASTILAKTRSARIVDDLAFSPELFVEPAPHGKAIALLVFASSELGSAQVEFLGDPVDDHLLELDREIPGILIEGAQDRMLDGRKVERIVGGGQPVQDLSPTWVHLPHVVDHVAGP
jgi:hypothetical protein